VVGAVTWRAFIGEWPGDHRTEADERGLTWERRIQIRLAPDPAAQHCCIRTRLGVQ
jgi:hypothetical protein